MIKKRKTGEHLENKKIKTEIIKFILREPEKVSEPEIRKHLNDNFNVIDQGTINKHLHFLSEELECIERVSTIKQGIKSYWDITNIKNLKNIQTNFPKIHLNEYEKGLLTVLHGNDYAIEELVGLKIYMRLFLSPSFFNMCLDMGVKTMCHRAWKIYKRNKMINFQNTIEKFRTDLQNDPDTNTIDFESLTATFLEIVKELPSIPLTMRDDDLWANVNKKITEFQPDNYLAGFLSSMIMDYVDIFNISLLVLLLDHFCDQDILLNVASVEEIKFVDKTNANLTLYIKSRRVHIDIESYKKWMAADLENISEAIFNFKTPSFFPVYKNSKDLNKHLLKFYEDEFKFLIAVG
jgi:hypothetical protein